MTYKEAIEKLGNRAKRKLENNTYLERRENAIAIRLHNTDVVTLHPCGSITLNSGGWKTVTTKDRMNKYAYAGIFQQRGIWFTGRDFSGRYRDGLTYKLTEPC